MRLKHALWLWLISALGVFRLDAQAPLARQTGPHLGYVYPAGGQRGTTFTVTVGGQFLEGVSQARFFGAGINARIVDYLHPTTSKEDEALKTELDQLLEKKRAAHAPTPKPSPAPTPTPPAGSAPANPAAGPGAATAPAKADPPAPPPTWTPEDDKRVEAIRQKLAYRMNRQTAPAISEAVVLEVTIAPDAELGEREICLRNASGLSNPLFFHVGELPEFTAPAAFPNTMPPEGRNPDNQRPLPAPVERMVSLPAVVNGQILPGAVDRIRFSATKGQKLVVAAQARALIPYLADAVPGWFQAVLTLRDAHGRELAYDDRFQFNPDPVLYYEIKSDGDYVVEICDSLFRGRQDFVYRLSIGELPFITGIFPLGGRLGTKTNVEVRGWNLPSNSVVVDATQKNGTGLELRLEQKGLRSNTATFALNDYPEAFEVEPNDDVAHAQKIVPPLIINGRIGHPDDRDVYCFEGKAGQEMIFEVFARRLNSPLDSILRISDAQGKEIAVNDDYDDKSYGLTPHQADSRIALKLPATGIYFIQISDTQHQGGPEFTYRLHVRPPRPDFEIHVVPSSINVRGNTYVPMTVFALRKDGFNGPVDLSLEEPTHSFGLSGARIPAGQDKIRFTLTTPTAPRDEAYLVKFVGHALINGKMVTHEAVPAEEMMQAFAYRHLVPSKETRVQVIGRGLVPKTAFHLIDPVPVHIPVGGATHFRVGVQAGKTFEKIQVELTDPVEGVTLQSATEQDGVIDVVLAAVKGKAKPGAQGNIILVVTGERPPSNEKKSNQAPGSRRLVLSALPAIPFTFVGK